MVMNCKLGLFQSVESLFIFNFHILIRSMKKNYFDDLHVFSNPEYECVFFNVSLFVCTYVLLPSA
jgi:hypothetical protein